MFFSQYLLIHFDYFGFGVDHRFCLLRLLRCLKRCQFSRWLFRLLIFWFRIKRAFFTFSSSRNRLLLCLLGDWCFCRGLFRYRGRLFTVIFRIVLAVVFTLAFRLLFLGCSSSCASFCCRRFRWWQRLRNGGSLCFSLGLRLLLSLLLFFFTVVFRFVTVTLWARNTGWWLSLNLQREKEVFCVFDQPMLTISNQL